MPLKSFLRPFKILLQHIWWTIKRKLFSPPPTVNGRTLLHLGCGPISAPGYTNVDVKPFSHVHYVRNAFPLEIFKSEKFDLVYASHVLEHFSIPEVPRVLNEWHRVLKPGGILRLGVPDFVTLIEIYKNAKDIKEIQGPLMGGQTDQYNFHKSVYDEKYLREILLAAGFREVQTWDPSVADHHEFKDTTTNIWQIGDKTYAISLNIEAVK